MTSYSALAHLTDETLHGEVKRLAGRTNTLTAELLAHLGEVEARGIHRERACSSLYTYCVYELCMSEDEAQRRCRAARLARAFPVLLKMLAEASLHLTGILLIGPLLTTENASELLARVRFRTKREIERIVGELAPAPHLPARIDVSQGEQHTSIEPMNDASASRPRCTWAAYVRALAGAVRQRAVGIAANQAPPMASAESCVDLMARSEAVEAHAGKAPLTERAPEQHDAVNRNAESRGARYRIQFTVDQAYLELLEEARELLQHVVPDRDLVEVQRRALQALVKSLRARKLGAVEHPRTTPTAPARSRTAPAREDAPEPHGVGSERKDAPVPAGTAPARSRTAPARSRHVPAAVRRTVWQRDAGRCAYADSRGQRCRERSGLEFHHRWPHARGGPPSMGNVELRCRAHNVLAAEHDFGRERMQRWRRQRRAEAQGGRSKK